MSEQSMKQHCNGCGRITNHRIIHQLRKYDEEYIDDNHTIIFNDYFALLECKGCEQISMYHKHECSEERDHEGKQISHITRHPPEEFRKKPRWCYSLGWQLSSEHEIIRELLDEVYKCCHTGSYRLATMGIRSLLEHAMIDKVGDNQDFANNIKEFFKAGHISKDQKRLLECVLDVGHAAMHRGYKPEKEALFHVIDVAESIIELIYIAPSRIKSLEKTTPKRTGRD